MNFLTNRLGRAIDQWNPLPTNDVSVSYDKVPVTGETVTFVTGAAGFSQTVSLNSAPVMNLIGDKVGSFWRSPNNLRLSNNDRQSTAIITAITETATAADVTITDPDYNLEQLFESPAATAGFIIVLRDPSGDELYGFIKGVAATSNSYVLSIFNTAALATQSWVGTLANFTLAVGTTKFEIYSNESSVAWTTGTVLTTEVPLPEDSDFDPQVVTQFLDGLSNGEYGVDYERGKLYYKKATTGTSDTIGYTTRSMTVVPTSSTGLTGTLVDDAAFTPATSLVTPVGYFADEGSTDSVGEGDIGAARMTLDRKQITASEHIEDVAHASADYGTHTMGVRNDVLAGLAGTDGDYASMQVDALGAQYVNSLLSLLNVTHRSPVDGTVAYTSTTTITCSSFPFTVADANCSVAYILYRPTGGQWQSPIINGQGGVSITSAANVITVAGYGTPFASADAYIVGIEEQDKGYTVATTSHRSEEVDPLSSQYISASLVDTTNVSAATHYYPSATGGTMDGYQDQSLTGKFIDADGTLTLTLEVTNDEDTSGDWNGAYFYDNELNATVNSKTVTNGTELFTLSANNNNFRRFRWVVIASGATNTVILKQRLKA